MTKDVKIYSNKGLENNLTLLQIFTFSFLVVSCGTNSDKESPRFSSDDQQSITRSGNLSTKFTDKAIVECSLEDLDRNNLMKNPKKFDVQLSRGLTLNVLEDLELKSRESLITPQNFWIKLDPKVRRRLNRVIVNSNLKQTLAEYKKRMAEVAFAFNVLLENQILDYGYLLDWSDSGKESKVSIAFSEKTEEYRSMSPCSDYSFQDIELPKTLLKPSDVTTKILCKNRRNDSIRIDGFRNKRLYLHLNSRRINDDIPIKQSKMKIISDSRLKRKIIYKDSFHYEYIQLNIDKLEGKPNSIDNLELLLKFTTGKKIRMSNLKCVNLKELKLKN